MEKGDVVRCLWSFEEGYDFCFPEVFPSKELVKERVMSFAEDVGAFGVARNNKEISSLSKKTGFVEERHYCFDESEGAPKNTHYYRPVIVLCKKKDLTREKIKEYKRLYSEYKDYATMVVDDIVRHYDDVIGIIEHYLIDVLNKFIKFQHGMLPADEIVFEDFGLRHNLIFLNMLRKLNGQDAYTLSDIKKILLQKKHKNETTKKKFYLAKFSGSYGLICDFSKAEIIEESDLLKKMFADGFCRECYEFKYNGFDKRIGFHSWSLLSNYNGLARQHYCWIYSTSSEQPYISEFEDDGR